jgi:lipid II:glycine glycyltransferase (peptidoglycan interpeptide bridge formation enzyme)
MKNSERTEPTVFSDASSSTLSEALTGGAVQPCRIEYSEAPVDEAWDRFLERYGGHHAQSSLWARAKESLGWSVQRIVVRKGEEIVGGAQMLTRKVGFLGKAAYILRGPVLGQECHELDRCLLEAILAWSKKNGTALLILQPPYFGHDWLPLLEEGGFRTGLFNLAITATLRLDLSLSEKELLGQMRRKTRQHIRQGLKAGVQVRSGTREDLPLFRRLLCETARRQGFQPEPPEFFNSLWNEMAPGEHLKLFIAEVEDEPVSALLTIPFAQSIYLKRIGWTGSHCSHWPNEVLHWETILWAKTHGYRYCDFEEVDPSLAGRADAKAGLDEALMKTPSFFKLGFGGEILPLPPAYLYFHNSMLRWLFNTGLSWMTSSGTTRNLIRRVWSRINS